MSQLGRDRRTAGLGACPRREPTRGPCKNLARRRAGGRRQGVEPRWGGAGSETVRNRVARAVVGRSSDENRISARVEGSDGVGPTAGIGVGEGVSPTGIDTEPLLRGFGASAPKPRSSIVY